MPPLPNPTHACVGLTVPQLEQLLRVIQLTQHSFVKKSRLTALVRLPPVSVAVLLLCLQGQTSTYRDRGQFQDRETPHDFLFARDHLRVLHQLLAGYEDYLADTYVRNEHARINESDQIIILCEYQVLIQIFMRLQAYVPISQ